jgi:hypothetical protein
MFLIISARHWLSRHRLTAAGQQAVLFQSFAGQPALYFRCWYQERRPAFQPQAVSKVVVSRVADGFLQASLL